MSFTMKYFSIFTDKKVEVRDETIEKDDFLYQHHNLLW